MQVSVAGSADPVDPSARNSPFVHRRAAHALPLWQWRVLVLLVLGLFGTVWLWHLDSVALAPPADNVEQLIWMHSLEWGYYKHPPLPTWMMWAFAQRAGETARAGYVLGALCTLGAFAFYTALLRDIGGQRFALLGLVAALCITYYNGRLYFYNHNTVLMLWVAASAWLWWRILARPQLHWWLALGVVAGLGMLSKYQYALTAVCGLWLFVRHGLWRDPAQRHGLWLALAVATVIFLPHGVWLLHQQHGGPIAYAMHSSLDANLPLGERFFSTGNWLVDWWFNRCLPAMLLLLAVWSLERRRVTRTLPVQQGSGVDMAKRGRSLLWCWGLMPPLLMAAMGLLGGVNLQMQWGTGFALWAVPVLMLVLGLSEELLQAQRALWTGATVFLVLQAAMLWVSYDTSAFGRRPSHPAHGRQFPAAALAGEIAPAARQALGGPVRIISGPSSQAGALALQMPEKPLVLIDGDLGKSPWVSSAALAHEGVLEIWSPEQQQPADSVQVRDGWAWRVVPAHSQAAL